MPGKQERGRKALPQREASGKSVGVDTSTPGVWDKRTGGNQHTNLEAWIKHYHSVPGHFP